MPVKPPTDAEVELLLCEDVREEAHGKFTLAGFYPGNSINVPQFGPSSPAFQIVFFFLIHSKEEGDYDATFHVVLPSGRPLSENPERFKVVSSRGHGAVQVIRFRTFIPLETGIWKAVLSLDGVFFAKQFEVTNDMSQLSTP